MFRGGQRLAITIAGESNIDDYRPLINDVLIRVRTELCVLESFIRETAIPFIQVSTWLPMRSPAAIQTSHSTSLTILGGQLCMFESEMVHCKLKSNLFPGTVKLQYNTIVVLQCRREGIPPRPCPSRSPGSEGCLW